MRRAAIRALRTARLTPIRKLLGGRGPEISLPSNTLSLRSTTSFSKNNDRPRSSSMYIRNFSYALVSTLVGSGAWYAYRTSSSGTDSSPSVPFTWFRNTVPSATQQPVRSPSIQPLGGGAEQESEPNRRALVVDNEQFYMSELTGDDPLSKDSNVLEMLTPDQATQKIRRNEESYLVGRGHGVVRYDVVQLASNNPIEDDHAERIVEIPQTVAATLDGTSSSDWMFWGVFDGHSGWTTSAKLRQVLISFVARELNATYKSALTDPSLTIPTPESIDSAIKKGFLRLDHEIIHESVDKVNKANSRRIAAELLAPALSGSCALLSFYDSKSKLLRVACTGDSRAVLGTRGLNGKWTATPLSEDQTGGTPSEMARLQAEHPGEEHVTKNGRILGGLEPSRAFGDSMYKWSKDVQDRMKKDYFGRSWSPLVKTPPYVTAEPVVTTTRVSPEKGDFVVMATDGLWEMLTNEEVVGLVGQWIERQGKGNSTSRSRGWLGTSFSASLPVEKSSNADAPESGQRLPIRQRQWPVTGNDERFVVEDKNAATHLIRNALGGRDRDMVCALLTLPSPYSRRYRDDLTVEVIFFGDGDNSGKVVPNPDASAPLSDNKAKL